ncbi:hypothetical protein D918_10118 [Trichuris suis]|nr:hypothetical protein D918_10118 [Trichuris suis]
MRLRGCPSFVWPHTERSPSRLPGPPSSGFGPAIDHRVAEPISLCSVDTPTTYSEGPVLLVVIGKTRGGEGAAERRFEPRVFGVSEPAAQQIVRLRSLWHLSHVAECPLLRKWRLLYAAYSRLP